MKKMVILTLILSSSVKASNLGACRGYAINHDSILESIFLEKNRDTKTAEANYNRQINQCDDNEDCISEAVEVYNNAINSVNESERNAILDAYRELATACSY